MTLREADDHPLLAAALAVETTDAALRALDDCAPLADLAEVRLDLMRTCDLARLIRSSPLPLIVTNRPIREGGRYEGEECERVARLAEAASLGAAYIDIEGDSVTAMELLLGSRPSSGVIVSRHEFARMPSDLSTRHRDLAAGLRGAVPKVVGMACQGVDTAAILHLLAGTVLPTVAIAMGPVGLASRVLALRYDATLLTFAAPPAPDARPTAPGQVSLDAMHNVFYARAISRVTAMVGLLCRTVELSLLGRYNSLLRESGGDAVCVPLPVADAADFDSTLQAFIGLGMCAFVVAADARGLLATSSHVSVTAHAPDSDILMQQNGSLASRRCGGTPAQQISALLPFLQEDRS